MTDALDLDALLADADWLRRLARRLVADPDLAEDFAQATTVKALEHRPRGRDLRGWLATVLRNLVRQHHRREAQRAEREARAAKPEALPSAADMVARVDASRQIAGAVLELEEPYRSVLLWRFFEALPPRKIAKRQGVSVATVNSRLSRGLARLRDRLDERAGGDRRAWLTAIVPLVARGSGWNVVLTGGVWMKTKAVAAAVVIGFGAWFLWPSDLGDQPGVAVDRSQPEAKAAGPVQRDDLRATRVEQPVAPAPAASPAARAARVAVRGRVVDVRDRPLAGVVIRSRAHDGSTTRSGPSGGFELELTGGRHELGIAEPGWITVVAGLVDVGDTPPALEPLVVAARTVAVSGTVVDAIGVPVPDASIRCVLPAGFDARFAQTLDASRGLAHTWRATTDSDGRFAIASAGVIAGASLVARKPNFVPAIQLVPEVERTDLRFVLTRPEPDANAIYGQVLDRFGTAVADARVCMGVRETRSDERGRFVLDRRKAQGDTRIFAMKRGHLPGQAVAPKVTAGQPAPFVFVRLGAKPLSITGTVVDAAGKPVAGARVWAANATVFPGQLGHVEGYLAGGTTTPELRRMFTAGGKLTRSITELKETRPTALWGWVATDRLGRFELGGLSARDYTLGVMLAASYRGQLSGPFPAGARGVTVRFRPRVYPKIAGVVVGRNGRPVPGVEIELDCKTITAKTGTWSSTAVLHGEKRLTDANGRFAYENVGAFGTFLSVNKDEIVGINVGLHDPGLDETGLGPVDALRIVVSRRVHLRIELGDRSLADQFRVVDAEGRPLPIVSFESGGKSTSRTRAIHDGRSKVYSVTQEAVAVVLLADDTEVARVPVTLYGGQVNVVRR